MNETRNSTIESDHRNAQRVKRRQTDGGRPKDDRSDRRDVTVLVTGAGAPGTVGTLWSLEHNDEGRAIRTIGTDVRKAHVGQYICDSFATVPPGDDDTFIDELVSICDQEGVDVVLPQVTAELGPLAEYRHRFREIGTTVAISGESAIERSNNKAHLIDVCETIGVPTPETYTASSWSDLKAAANTLGFPERKFVVKPPVANGQRGFRIVTSGSANRLDAFYEEKPDGTTIPIDHLRSILGDSFPELLVMEYLPGTEYSVDAFRCDGETVVVPRTRDAVRSGISFTTTIDRQEQLLADVEQLAETLDLRYAFGFQFKQSREGDLCILECNPRIQGTMVASSLAGTNVTYAAVRAAADAVSPAIDEPNWGTTCYRYWGGLGVSDGSVVANIGEHL